MAIEICHPDMEELLGDHGDAVHSNILNLLYCNYLYFNYVFAALSPTCGDRVEYISD